MFRFLCKLLKIDFEPCKGCEVLKQQLIAANEQNKFLMETLTTIVNPKTIPVEQPVKQVNLAPASMLFSKRRAVLEERDRIAATLQQQSPFMAKPDKGKEIKQPITLGQPQSVEALEKELGIEEEVKNG